MNKNIFIRIAFALLAILIFFSFLEFILRPSVSKWIAVDRMNETDVDKWKFILSASVFSVIALIVPSVILFRKLSELEKLNEEITKSSTIQKKSEEQLEAIVNNTKSVIYMKDIKGRYLLINKRFENLFDLKNEEVQGKTDLDIFPKDIAEDFMKIDRKVMDSGKPFEGEEVAPHVDGIHNYISIKVPLFNSKGDVYGLCGISTDITYRKQIEERLRQSEIIVSSTTGILALLDKEFTYVAINPAYLKIVDKTYDQMIGKKANHFFGEEFFLKVIKPNAERCFRGEEVHFEEWYYFPALGKRYMEITYYPHYGVDNEIKGFVVSGRDVTDRKLAEEELERHRNSLEELIEERTRELKKSQKQLLHSAKLSSLGKLTGAISHEFNNPLQGIRNVISIMASLDSIDEKSKFKKLGEKECDRMAKMIQGLRDFYKPTTGNLSSVDVNKCLEEVIALQKLSLEENGIEVSQRFSNNLPKLDLVEDQIKQVLLNLIQNSADSITGGGEIAMTTEMQDSSVVIKIQDTGCGISEDDQKHIFEPFYSTKEGKGTGLGLSISYGIIRDHGGEIKVESELDKGTAFKVILPIESK